MVSARLLNPADDKFSYQIIGQAMKVHSALGSGLDERFYQDGLVQRLQAEGFNFESKPRTSLVHRGIVADAFEPDLVIANGSNQRVVELKVLTAVFAPEHFAQVIAYLKFRQIPVALLCDFGKESLVTKRIPWTDPGFPELDGPALIRQIPNYVCDSEVAKMVIQAALALGKQYGLGYTDKSWKGLFKAEFQAQQLAVRANPQAQIKFQNHDFGPATFECLVVENTCALLILALRDTIHAADRALLQTQLHYLALKWGIIFNFGKKNFHLQFVKGH